MATNSDLPADIPRPPDETADAAASSLENVVAESAARLHDAAEPPIKKKRGRPRKPAPSQQKDAGVSGPGEASSSSPPPPSLKPVLLPAIKLPFEVAAARRRFPGWCLSDPEADALATQAEAIAQVYMPQLNSPFAIVAVFLLTASLFIGVRYVGELNFRADNAKDVTEAPPSEPPPPTPPSDADRPGVSALTFFQ